jgi:DNA invertase Pin-like site-specific DNA recombinase
MTRAAIYCRVSSPGQKDTTSLPEQERLDREKAAQLGWEVSEAHVYHEVEGGEDLYRPKMDRLWDGISRHEIDGLIFDVVDRLSRETGDQGAVYHHCDKYGVRIAVASQDIDETEKGRALRDLAGIVARMEHADIRRRTQRGRHARVDSGKMFTAAWPLYGYLWGDPAKGARTHYIIDPETAPIVQRIFQQAALGVPIRQIARELERDGVPTPFQTLEARGQLPKNRSVSAYWRRGQLIRMLRCPAYWGQHSAYRSETTKIKVRPADTGITKKVHHTRERALDDPARVALHHTAPALVSKDLADRAQAQLTINKEQNAGNNPDPLATIWRGMAYCGHCGSRLTTGATRASKAGEDDRRYICRARQAVAGGITPPCAGGRFSVKSSVLDAMGWADVRAWLDDDKNVARLMEEWRRRQQTGEQSAASRLTALTAHLTTLREKLARLSDAIAETENTESRRALQEKQDAVGAQIQAEEVKRTRLLQEERAAAAYARDERDLRQWVCEVATQADAFTALEQRATLRALGARVTVWRTDYHHPDGWPQRYQIELTFTGLTGDAVRLPARTTMARSDPHYT